MFQRLTTKYILLLAALLVIGALSSCTVQPQPTASPVFPLPESPTPELRALPTPSPTPEKRVLTICTLQEPVSLFIYNDQSQAARNIREAIYDGPVDMLGYRPAPVILTELPTQANGGVIIESLTVSAGANIVNAQGELVNLKDGVQYYPAGCRSTECALTYQGQEPAQMDQMVVRYHLRPGLQWSDGSPLTADDSQYSFEVARELYPRVRQNLITHTAVYQAEDSETVLWRGLPGYRDPAYGSIFFQPLPRHAWGSLPAAELLANEGANRAPLGWGAYTVVEWTEGDHITLAPNPLYFRAAEGLPYFDNLVFRFISDQDQILAGLLAGECDLIDDTAGLETRASELNQLQEEGKLLAAYEVGTAWEHLDFGIEAYDPAALANPTLFQSPQLRQAIATCIDRERLANELFFGISDVPVTYVPPTHPLANPDAARYAYDPQAGGALLEAAGWLDPDQNPATPRQAQGVSRIVDGTPLAMELLASNEPEKQAAAAILQSSLAECGIQLDIRLVPLEELYSPGPEGPVFGRAFQLAQFNWSNSYEPPCFLYLSSEIPGPYPEYARGWGGANASGYRNPEYDTACRLAMNSLPEDPEYAANHLRAQEIFATDLPAIPLYMRLKLVAGRPDLCEMQVVPGGSSALWNLESLNYGETCGP
ncbi:MAG TPA: peptide ABC transporter substrate-binding protein [Anaerolineales bacterium]|nr:peptide ABC transporter substrate-binding protein [Anaerolineales bacterium]